MDHRLFNDAVSSPTITYRRVVWEDCRIPQVLKDLEEVVADFMVLSQQSPGGSEENHDESQIIRCPVRDSKRPPLEYRLNQLYQLVTYINVILLDLHEILSLCFRHSWISSCCYARDNTCFREQNVTYCYVPHCSYCGKHLMHHAISL
jgi:hypothetical protein